MTASRRIALIAVFVSCLPTVSAQTQTYNGGGLNPLDNVPGGLTSTITIADLPSLTGFNIQVSVIFTDPAPGRHTWAGDTIFRLTGPNAATVDLLVRPGNLTSTATGGESSNLNGTYTFADSATTRLIIAGQAVVGDDTPAGDIPSGLYQPTTNQFLGAGNGAPNFPGEVVQTLNGSFGTTGNGNWSLFYSDNAANDYAAMDSWRIAFVPVPEPASLLALSSVVFAGGTAVSRRFRRRVTTG